MDEKIYIYDLETLEFKQTNKYNDLKKVCFGLVCFIILLFGFYGYLLIDSHKKIVDLQNTIQDKDIQIEEIQNICNYENIVKYKAGEYAMHPHKLVNVIDDTSVANLMIELNAWYPDIKMAQIKIESGFGSSQLAKRSNNICGMRKTTSRETTQIKKHDSNGYGVYNNWESCVIDMVLWDKAVFGNRKPTRQDYIKHLNDLYSETDNYGNKVDEIGKKYLNLFQ